MIILVDLMIKVEILKSKELKVEALKLHSLLGVLNIERRMIFCILSTSLVQISHCYMCLKLVILVFIP